MNKIVSAQTTVLENLKNCRILLIMFKCSLLIHGINLYGFLQGKQLILRGKSLMLISIVFCEPPVFIIISSICVSIFITSLNIQFLYIYSIFLLDKFNEGIF